MLRGLNDMFTNRDPRLVVLSSARWVQGWWRSCTRSRRHLTSYFVTLYNSDVKKADWQTRGPRRSVTSDDKDTDPVSCSICWVASLPDVRWQAETSNERDHTESDVINVISKLSTAKLILFQISKYPISVKYVIQDYKGFEWFTNV